MSDESADNGHRSVPPVVASLAVDAPTAARIADTFVGPRNPGRPSRLGQVIVLLVLLALIAALLVGFDQVLQGSAAVTDTPAPSF